MRFFSKYALAIFFLAVLTIGGIWNLPAAYLVSNEVAENESLRTLEDKFQAIQDGYQENFEAKEQLVDLYGLTQLGLQKRIIGNFEFAKDDSGNMQIFERPADYSGFEESVLALNDRLQREGIPLLFVQIPDPTEKFSLAENYSFSFQTNWEMYRKFQENGIDCFDVQKEWEGAQEKSDLGISPDRMGVDTPILSKEFYLATDGHACTESEFWLASTLVNHMENSYGLAFANKDEVFDSNCYQWGSHDFLGSRVRSVGRFYAGKDSFLTFTPLFDTNLTIWNPESSRQDTGDFSEILTNQYEHSRDIDDQTYWVINYGQYPDPYYVYRNNLVAEQSKAAPRLLVISDSIFMRGTTFLALCSQTVTVIDPRQKGGSALIEQALDSQEYDAVIICGSSNDFWSESFSTGVVVSDLPQRARQGEGNGGVWIGNCNGKKQKKQSKIYIDNRQQFISLDGWAADFTAMKPLSELYVRAGDLTVRCDYGSPLPGLVSKYENEDLRNVGFSVTLLPGYIRENNIAEISFIQVSEDGKTIYEPVVYGLEFLS